MSNDIWGEPRKRRQNLFIVEGNHEKNELFGVLFRCFPELKIDMDDVLIYGTNIYKLYNAIVTEYGEDWFEQDIDLPFIISKKKNLSTSLHKNDFINIVLIFDYEHHDPDFSEEKILKMQRYFDDSTDFGKLYINYPMIESYQDLVDIPDADYINRCISVTLQPGIRYKNLVKDSKIARLVNLRNKMEEILQKRFGVENRQVCSDCVERLLNISDSVDLLDQIYQILNDILMEPHIHTAKYQLRDVISKAGYSQMHLNYYEYMRKIFKQIIIHNTSKANRIQNEAYQIREEIARQDFLSLDFETILHNQNLASQSQDSGYIWVLNTCVFVIPDYNFELIL